MTSTASPQSNPAPNSSAATSAPSYASAAGANKKQASTPLIATGSNPPVVVGGSSAQNAKPSAPSPVNGRPPITPAVPAAPAVAHGSSNMNGNATDHSRKSSVTLANGPNSFAPNGGPVGGSKPGIQFGYNSPAVAHSTPQSTAAPIPIPGAHQRVPSPAHSPSPIPQPSASGGRPPSGMAHSGAMTFGSLGSDGDRHMRQASTPQSQAALPAQPGSHIRRESGVSQHSDVSGPVGPNQGPNRQGFQPQGGRGRGFNPQHPPYNANMGFPPGQQYGNGRGRGAMPPSFHPGRTMPYPNSPQPTRSPALAQSQPGTPNMAPAQMHPMPMATPPQHYYPPPNMAPQQVQHPSSFPDVYVPSFNSSTLSTKNKRKNQRRDWDKSSQKSRHADLSHESQLDVNRPRRHSRREEQIWVTDHERYHLGNMPHNEFQPGYFPEHGEFNFADQLPMAPDGSFLAPPPVPPLDLSPETGNYERLLTQAKQQQYGYPPPQGQFDNYGRPIYYNQMGYMPSPPGAPPAFQPGFVPPPFHQPAPTAMSRTSSHSERPSSSTGQPAAPVVSGTPQPQNAQVKTPMVVGNNFVRPKKSAAIVIKNAAGEAVDFKSMKTPSSPAPSIQQSKTPPIVTSTPTPPPKSATPSHVRNDSQATPKTAREIQDELRAKIQQATKGGEDKAKEEAEAKAKAAEEEKKTAEAKAKAEAEEKAKEEARKAEEEAAEAKRKAQEEEKAKAEADAKAEAEAKAKAEAEKPAEPVAEAETEDERMERMIREMEEEDARREKEAAEYNAKKAIEKEAAKKAEEEKKKANAADEDRKLREAEREMERLEEEKERKRAQGASSAPSVAELLAKSKSGDLPDEPAKVGDVADKLSTLSIGVDSKASTPTEASAPKATPTEKRGAKPSPLNLAPLNTKPVEPPQPSAALQSLKSARFLQVINQDTYPAGISSPNPALNAAVAKKGKTFKYDAQFLLQFQKVFTEQPSMEFHQQVKSLIGDNDGSRSASTPRAGSGRGNSQRGSAAGVMGKFGAPGGPMNPNVRGTTSAERFAMSNAAMSAGGMGGMGNFRPSFPVAGQMARTPSSSNMGPNSPRTRSQRGGGSRRNDFNAKEAQAAKTMPLTQGMEVKPIAVSATGWKPTSIGKGGAAGSGAAADHMDPEMVQRKVKAALNKMTPEKFDKIADQILAIAGQSKDESDGRTLRQVIQLTFEKATDEAHWASMYAKFCKRMLDTMSAEIRDENIKDKNGVVVSGGALFRKYLLNRCQEEFERGWKVNLPELKEGEKDKATGEAVMLSDEYYIAAAAKRRGLGLVQFIGELYKLGMLTERIMHECVRKLVDYEGVPDEAEIESLSKLLRTIGGNLDASDKGKQLMNAYFERIQHMVDMPELASRLKFMLMDVIDLRRSGWSSKEANKGPKTLEEIRAEAEAAAIQKAQENQRSGSQRGGPGGRPNLGRGDSRNFSSGYMQAASNQVGMDDLRRLKGSTSRAASGNVTLGPTSMFASRSNSGRRLGPGGSLGRPGEDSGASSRTGTPPTTQHTNAFSALANLDSENPASPPSTAASPALSKAVPDSSAAGGDK
ncbi:Eukaryotic translation initiation factor 4 gamma [Colletotrichum sp. SAR 10_99]|nr:Eukaryotic translation initiation factor 4 gamma [Colletotrichum sp. SAR 10_96]KAJ5009589.1 Eukaryotic translation initiation factor 4 gamma [Colletotrichum sp. SAR 10_99]